MVDKKSLRSGKSGDNKKDASGSSSSNNNNDNNPSKPTRTSSRRTGSGSSTKKPTPEKTDKKMAADKKPEPPVEDAQMKDKKDDSGDIEMGDVVKSGNDDKDDEKAEEQKEDPAVTTYNEIKQNFILLERAVNLFDARYTLRVLRSIASLRRKITPEIIAKIVDEAYPVENKSRSKLLSVLGHSGSVMEVEREIEIYTISPDVLHEIDVYLHLLTQIYLLDQKKYQEGAAFSSELVEKVHRLNRRTLDSLASKVYFYYARFHELLPPPAVVAIRAQLLASLRTATLRKDIELQATLITLLLRNYISTSDITQADHLVNKTKFPDHAANNLIARYNYYLGKIKAIQLDYSGAHEQLVSAIRKAPQSPAAIGFLQAANKLNIIVELLMGDIPDRATFRDPHLQKALYAYFLLVRAVRVGELDAFFETLNTHADTFRRDGTYTLVLRLRQNVIKTGIRMMSLTYSRISLRDICIRLGLESEESAEYIVAKAIRDGVIEATLDHEKGFMQSKEILDVYATQEPQEVFHSRITFCMSLHNDSVKAMRFPMNQHRLELKNAQEARERERELAKEIQEGEMDDDDVGGEFDDL
ncbi:proteasome regulatory subunit C-terminal-domain-containing protein [Tricharina praecox]|uniref:proteasome regulatory subunit C-terminal-domain-containing protein n=1 Tax=Tricharina praecox TaxID=43433 RepID=UPI00221F98AD|nr:proteasome regulatory subunit C-terminal-domain-containing protein [Tricharina praecox]KAI5857995.1 proteasome regulatory subunit C-terminal-domain-containing protein [Tricharina praecox]